MLGQRINIIKNIAVGAVIVLSASISSAGVMSGGSTYHDSLAKAFGVVATNPSTPQQLNIFNELLGSNEPGTAQLNWPNFPRTWVQKDRKNTVEAFATVSFKINTPSIPLGPSAGIEHKTTVNYQYSKKISFIAVTTVDSHANLPINENGVTTVPTDIEAVRYTDARTGRNYFNASAKNPMIGFCVYELQMNIVKSHDNKVTFGISSPIASMGAEGGVNMAETMTETQSVYSKFFQIEKSIPEMDYLTVKCEEHFQKMVQAYAESNFEKIINEYWGFYHPGNECQGTSTRNPKGDPSCANFFDSQSADLQSKTVARCERQKDGLNKCVLKSKKDTGMCGLYVKQGGGYTTVREEAKKRIARGGVFYESYSFMDGNVRPCDKGLSCVVSQEKPYGIFGFLFQNIAYCK